MMNNWVSHILFLRKRGLIVYLAALKRGLFGPHFRTMSHAIAIKLSIFHLITPLRFKKLTVRTETFERYQKFIVVDNKSRILAI